MCTCKYHEECQPKINHLNIVLKGSKVLFWTYNKGILSRCRSDIHLHLILGGSTLEHQYPTRCSQFKEDFKNWL